MGCGGRSSRLIFWGLRRYNSKIAAQCSPIQEFVSRRTFSWRINRVEKKQQRERESPLVDGAKRFYNWGRVDNQVHEFKVRKRWMWNLESSVVLALLSGLVALDICFGSWETVPYTKRRQLLVSFFLAHLDEDGGSGTVEYEKVKKDLTITNIILPPLHPDSVRVQTIVRGMIEAFRRKEGDARIKKTWEVLVINVRRRLIDSSPDGKIFISTAILGSCEEDTEIAAFIAPEVGRVVARHAAERFSISDLLSSIFLLILHAFVCSRPSLWKFFRFPFVRSVFYYLTWVATTRLLMKIYSLKLDFEADYIGLMLLASAGYDPRVALQAREKIIRTKGGSWWEKMRARRLVLGMEDALSIYREVMAEHDD